MINKISIRLTISIFLYILIGCGNEPVFVADIREDGSGTSETSGSIATNTDTESKNDNSKSSSKGSSKSGTPTTTTTITDDNTTDDNTTDTDTTEGPPGSEETTKSGIPNSIPSNLLYW